MNQSAKNGAPAHGWRHCRVCREEILAAVIAILTIAGLIVLVYADWSQ